MPVEIHGRQHLIFDADDTLWENNIYFERAFDEFVDFLAHSSLSATQVRDILDELEAANAKIHGYGSHRFGKNLQEVYQHLCERHVCDADLATVMSFAERILEAPMELLPGVEDTIAYLAACGHDLLLLTKGNPDEQQMKIDRSGLAHYFSHTRIVREKNTSVYESLAVERDLDIARAWMIGNSPKSDINPSLDAGLNAIYVPHERTWILEKAEIRQPTRSHLLTVERFTELRELFR
ncbi:haloacid dehalogenase [Bryobacterales bacterium F-183]|nr:haloacid dehalogenase [Bryobacterales bacterium F-183]